MAKLQEIQTKELRQIYAQLCQEVERAGVQTPDNAVASALMKICPERGDELPAERHKRYKAYYREIKEGYEAFERFQRELVMDGLPLDTRKVYQLLTRSMSAGERMGLYLQCYESNRAYNARLVPDLKDSASAADLAVLDEDSLLGVVSEQTELLTEYLILSTFEKGRPPAGLHPLVYSEDEALLFAAAICAAAENGTLPQELGAYPQLLGISAACGTAIMRREWTEEGNGIWEMTVAMLLAIAVGIIIAGITIVGPSMVLTSVESISIFAKCLAWFQIICGIGLVLLGEGVTGSLAYEDWLPRLRGFYRTLKDPNRSETLSALEPDSCPVPEQEWAVEQTN